MSNCLAYQTSLAYRPCCKCHSVGISVSGVHSTQMHGNCPVSGRRPWAASAQMKSLVWWSSWRALKLTNQPLEALNVAVLSMCCASSCSAFPLTACPSVRDSFSHAINLLSSCFASDGTSCTFKSLRSLLHGLSDFCHSRTCFCFTPKCSAAFLLLPNSFATTLNLEVAL